MAGAPTRRFRYRGRVVEAREGETLLAAIARDALPTLERSTRYHRPRAPFCGIGQCTGCLVRVNDEPLVRACRYHPGEDDRVENGPGWPSVRWDALVVLDLIFRRGLDPFRGFRRPAVAGPIYQRLVRRLAGYGAPAPVSGRATEAVPPVVRSAEVVVVGGGESGSATAARLVTLGYRPLVLDRDRRPGLVGADWLGGVSVTLLGPRVAEGAELPFRLLGPAETGAGLSVRARSVVVATGGYDASLLFGGNDRPGVLTADAALAFSSAPERAPFGQALLVGGDRRAEEVLARLGSRVAAVIAVGEVRPEVVRAASALGIPLYPRSLLLGVIGRTRVRGLRLRTRGGGPRFSLAGDAVVLAHRRIPNAPLLFLAGAEMAWHAGPGAYYPVLDAAGTTSVPGLYAVGTVTGTLEPARREGAERAAFAIAGRAASDSEALPRVRAEGPSELEGYYRELLTEPRRGRWIACRCEDVLLHDLETANRGGYRGLEVVKRYTSLGTGLCQGRYCTPDALLILSVLEGRPPSEVGRIRQRPPVYPMPLGTLAELDDSVAGEVG